LTEEGFATVDAVAAGTTNMMLITGLRLITMKIVAIVFAMNLVFQIMISETVTEEMSRTYAMTK
jgi:hypothetical protein